MNNKSIGKAITNNPDNMGSPFVLKKTFTLVNQVKKAVKVSKNKKIKLMGWGWFSELMACALEAYIEKMESA